MGAIVTLDNDKRTTTYSDLNFRLRLDISMPKNPSGKGIRISDDLDDRQKGLDMDFHIVKSTEAKPTESTITIYNLTTETYDKIYQYGKEFTLSCAFSDEDYTVMYRGYSETYTQHKKKIILTANEGFMAQDANAGRRGQNDLQTEIKLINYGIAQLNKTYRKPVNTETILNDCISALGMPKGEMDIIKHKNINGYRAVGNVYNTLNYLGQLLGFNFCINSGRFCAYDKTYGQMKKYGIYLHSGNSNTPEKQDDKFVYHAGRKATKKKTGRSATTEYERMGYMIETRLLPFLQVGSTVKCDFKFKDCKGLKYVYKLEHIGSNYAGTQMVTRVYCV
jgi:hypothetical protein